MPEAPVVVAQQWVSLDGFASGEVDETAVMEAVDAEADARSQQYNEALSERVSRVLLGRRTYAAFSSYWPEAEERIAPFVNRVPKTVASTTLSAAPWGRHDPAEVVEDGVVFARRFRQEGSGVLLVWGSLALTQRLADAGVLDELDLFVSPVLLASGTRVLSNSHRLRQLASEDWGTITHLRYALT
jgi:dihydrofolate reductase